MCVSLVASTISPTVGVNTFPCTIPSLRRQYSARDSVAASVALAKICNVIRQSNVDLILQYDIIYSKICIYRPLNKPKKYGLYRKVVFCTEVIFVYNFKQTELKTVNFI